MCFSDTPEYNFLSKSLDDIVFCSANFCLGSSVFDWFMNCKQLGSCVMYAVAVGL